VKVNAVPIEAYRRTAGIGARRNESSAQEQAGAKRPGRPEKVTVTSSREAAAPSVQARISPSLLEGVLSAEEKNELIRHFARFGDTYQESQIYGSKERVDTAGTGIRVDVKA
jgi:hypothetical protein